MAPHTIEPGRPLIILRHLLDRIIAHVREGAPLEVCGMMGGVGRRVLAVFPVPNVAANPAVEYRMDGQSQINHLLELDKRNWDLVAIYHSHPSGATSEPSTTDIAQAYYPESLCVILRPDSDGDGMSVRAFSIRQAQVREVRILIE
jgi:proteasome lid subunit RPN8/RPN11